MATTSDPSDPRLTRGADDKPVPMAEVYLVLSDREKEKGFVRPVRQTYFHTVCQMKTSMALSIAETYAAKPDFYGSTYCTTCCKHLPVGEDGEFFWVESTGERTTQKVGT